MVNQRETTHIRIDRGLHALLKKKAKRQGVSVKELLEGYLAEFLAVKR